MSRMWGRGGGNGAAGRTTHRDMGTARDRLDEQARRELDEETEVHRLALKAISVRDIDDVVAEANRHFRRVQEIMRDFARRKRQRG